MTCSPSNPRAGSLDPGPGDLPRPDPLHVAVDLVGHEMTERGWDWGLFIILFVSLSVLFVCGLMLGLGT